MSNHFKDSEPKARKEYVCVGCHKTIKIGEVHAKSEFIDCGQIDSWRLCLECDSVRDAVYRLFDACDIGLTDCEFYDGIQEIKKGYGR